MLRIGGARAAGAALLVLLLAAPAAANPVDVSAGLLLPILVPLFYILTAATREIAEKEGKPQRPKWEWVVATIGGMIFGPLGVMVLGLLALINAIGTAVHGIRALRAPEARPPHLKAASPGRLMACSGFLALLGLASCGIGTGALVDRRLIRKSSEGAGKGNLGALRSALSIYYGETEGRYPADLTALTMPLKGEAPMKRVPNAKAPNYHPDSSGVRYNLPPDDSGGWVYTSDPKLKTYGDILVNCTHTDTKGTVWTSY